MKKFHIFLIVFVLFLSNIVVVQASSEPKLVHSDLVASADQVKVGETIILTATTLKQGSAYLDEWDGAVTSKSYFDESTSNYISQAEFTPSQAGTYTITYTIKMHTGNDDVKFISSTSKMVEVLPSVKEVVGLEVRNVKAYPNTGTDGTLKGYSVLGELYVLWNDNTSSLYGAAGYFFLPNETSRIISTPIQIDNQEYIFSVTVSIPQ